MHRLLQRQIYKLLPEDLKSRTDLQEFLDAVSSAYLDYDADHDQIERTLEISSNELFKTNQQLNENNTSLEAKVELRTAEYEKLNSELLHEIEVRKIREQELHETDLILSVSNDAATQLLVVPIFKDAIHSALMLFAPVVHADRVFLFEKEDIRSKENIFNERFSWTSETGALLDDQTKKRLNLLNEGFSEWLPELHAGRVVAISHEDNNDSNNAFLAKHKAHLLILAPVFSGDKLWGFVGFENSTSNRQLRTAEIGILKNFASSIGGLVQNNNQEAFLVRNRQELLEAQSFARMGTFEIDLVNGVSSFTEQGAKLLGMSIDEMRFDHEFVSRLRRNVIREDLEKIDKAWVSAMQNKQEVRLDFRIKNESGSISCLNWNVKPEFAKDSKLIRVTGTLQDVTERMLLEERSKMARLIIENSPTVLFRWSMDDSFPVEFVSENISQFGYDADDFLERRINFADIIIKDDLERIRKEVKQYHQNNVLLYTQTYRIYNKSGEIRWVEDRTMVERNDQEDAVFHQGLITDITDRVNAQLALENSEKRFRSMVQNSSDITSILDADGIIRYESASFFNMFGFTSEEVIGKSVQEFLHPDDLEKVMQSLQQLVEVGEQTSIVFRFKRKDGSYIYLEALGSNQFSEPSINGIVVNSRDVTERLESENQMREYANTLEKINKELDQFAYIVSHDLKAPLRAINNLSIWIEEDLEGKMEPDTRKNFDMLRGRTHRMESLINGILQYSRAGRVKSENIPIDVNAFVKDIIHNLSPPELFKVLVDENLPVIQGEKLAIDQVFSNFISNAIKYNTNEKPEIKVFYEDLGSMHKFGVSDNGPGIAPEFFSKIFVIFQTLQARDVIESTGVGLAIVKKIVEEKGGQVWLESELNKGTTFYFTLPKI
jgi:PAS domain S-box-containing protein